MCLPQDSSALPRQELRRGCSLDSDPSLHPMSSHAFAIIPRGLSGARAFSKSVQEGREEWRGCRVRKNAPVLSPTVANDDPSFWLLGLRFLVSVIFSTSNSDISLFHLARHCFCPLGKDLTTSPPPWRASSLLLPFSSPTSVLTYNNVRLCMGLKFTLSNH
jgi:hypothetical protein